MPQPIRVLCYAINGTGLGHLSRLLAVGRRVRELCEVLGVDSDVRFLTTSEAPQVAWDFPVYKLPSLTVAKAAKLDSREYSAGAKLLVSNLVSGLHPDLLVMDTLPQGAFGEMAFLRSYTRASAFIDRHKDPKVAASEVQLSHQRLFDRILVPDDESRSGEYPIHPDATPRRRFVGTIHGYRTEDSLGRDEVRNRFGVKDGRRLIYLSAGGGGDARAEADLNAWIEALAGDDNNHLLVGYGPLYRGPMVQRENVTASMEPSVARYFRGLDAAISAAGYNTYHELLAAQVPCLFFAQAKGMDRQDQRILEGLAAGYHGALDLEFESLGAESRSCPPSERPPAWLRSQVEALLSGGAREAMVMRLAARPIVDGALHAAVELLCLHAGLAGSPLSRERVREAGSLCLAFSDATRCFVPAATAWLRWQGIALDRSSRQDTADTSAASYVSRGGVSSTQAGLDWAARQLSFLEMTGLSKESLERLWRAFCAGTGGKLGLSEERRRRNRLGECLDILLERAAHPELAGLLEAMLDGLRDRDFAPALHGLTAWLDGEPDGPEWRPGELPRRLLAESAPTPLNDFEALFRQHESKGSVDANQR